MRHPNLPAVAAVLVVCALAGCGGQGGSGFAQPSPSTPAPTADARFAGRTYRLDLPSDWVALGTPAYDASVDAPADVQAWLRALKLTGPNAFRAYEPVAHAAGLRLAANPPIAWDSESSGPLNSGDFSALPGAAEVSGEWVAIGETAKASRFRWTQTLDWGDGTPGARSCVGYQVYSDFDPVNVVFSYPVGRDRLAEVESLMETFVVTGSPVISLPPGATPTPSPTPFDKERTPAPTEAAHGAPELEALLPDSVDGQGLSTSSQTGVELGMTSSDPILRRFGRQPADLALATAMPNEPPLLIVSVMRLRGVGADALLTAILATLPDATVTHETIDGRNLTYLEAGAWPVWYWPAGEHLYGISAIDRAAVSHVLAQLP